MENRIQRIVLETRRNRIVGDLTMPSEGYRSRLTDFLNRGDVDFIPLVDVEIAPIAGGESHKREFIAVARTHVDLAYPAAEADDGSEPS